MFPDLICHETIAISTRPPDLHIKRHSHDVRDNADTPHVRVQGEGFVVDHFGAHEFRRAKHLPDLFPGLDLPTEAEVDQLQQVAVGALEHDVLRLKDVNPTLS